MWKEGRGEERVQSRVDAGRTEQEKARAPDRKTMKLIRFSGWREWSGGAIPEKCFGGNRRILRHPAWGGEPYMKIS